MWPENLAMIFYDYSCWNALSHQQKYVLRNKDNFLKPPLYSQLPQSPPKSIGGHAHAEHTLFAKNDQMTASSTNGTALNSSNTVSDQSINHFVIALLNYHHNQISSQIFYRLTLLKIFKLLLKIYLPPMHNGSKNPAVER